MSEHSVSGGGGSSGGSSGRKKSFKEKKGERERERERALGPGDYLKNMASTRTGLENRRTMRLSVWGMQYSFISLFLFSFFFLFFSFLSTVFSCKQNGLLFYVRQSPEGCARLRSRRTGRQVKQQGRGMTIAKKSKEKKKNTYR